MDPGKYVLAVSGGVDSMVLLDILAKKVTDKETTNYNLQPTTYNLGLVVAHFNHGIRADSAEDEALVAAAAKKYGLTLEIGWEKLGADASEAAAREARYKFLNLVKRNHRADAIITAHHQDDLIETAIINILRGTGPRGLMAMANNPEVIRPLLKVSKLEILDYAQKNKIVWREDSTNQDEKYLRNYIRKNILAGLPYMQRQALFSHINKAGGAQAELAGIVKLLAGQLQANGQIDRQQFISLPNDLGRELVVHWLRGLGFADFDKKTIERVQMYIKTAQGGTRHNIGGGLWLVVDSGKARFEASK